MKIGIFDSGIGGLSLLHKAMSIIPEVDYVFYADVDHVPYGERKSEEIYTFVDEAVGFLVNKGCEAIVLACNTATSVAITPLRNKYKIPVVGIEPAVKPAVMHCNGKRVMVVATPVTAKGAKLKNLIMRYDTENLVDVIALPKLVRFAQNDIFTGNDVMNYLNNSFAGYNPVDYSQLVLGCTHFNYFKDSFAKIFKDADIIDGNEGVSNNLRNILIKNGVDLDSERKKHMLALSEREMSDKEQPKAPINVEYYYSGRKVGEEETEHIKLLHKRLEEMQRI